MLKVSLGALCAMGVICGPAAADEAVATAPGEVQEVVVFGRGEAKIGIAHAASEGTVAGSDLLVRPLLRTAELLEAVPGLIAAQPLCQAALWRRWALASRARTRRLAAGE